MTTIKLKDSDAKISRKQFPYSEEDKKEFEIQNKELLQLRVIKESTSPYNSQAFMVRNHSAIKRGKVRMVIDYRYLNSKTIPNSYKLSIKELLIKQIQVSKIYSKFDCKLGYWQIKLDEKSKSLSSFTTPNPLGQFEWNVM